MIIINNVKYACATCIRVNHRDRPLLPIRRKGRPISQCDRCREQRLKHSVHQKCVCRQSKLNEKPAQVHEEASTSVGHRLGLTQNSKITAYHGN
ncbi:hypothetical protein VTP01DRAFT_1586 [Rhizomucor pusillus]|uniref:uncharacterized protein n=1 Tax=Rhizomucor pusillus TaxID=4840 RepID=UPI0037446C72